MTLGQPLMVLLTAACLVISTARAGAEDWWGRRLPDTPTEFIFGYGSLIDAASRDATAGKSTAAIPVRVSASFGYVRTWNDRSPSGFTALGLRKPHAGEQASTINGVIYPVAQSAMKRFDEREQGYVQMEIPHDAIQPVSWQPVPAEGHIWVYVPDRKGDTPGVSLPEADAAFPMLQSYIDLVLAGASQYGPAFAVELIETTRDWSRYWLNDRELARRPWVHDPQYEDVDHLLASTAPASAAFQERMFAEPYAAKWLLPRTQ